MDRGMVDMDMADMDMADMDMADMEIVEMDMVELVDMDMVDTDCLSDRQRHKQRQSPSNTYVCHIFENQEVQVSQICSLKLSTKKTFLPKNFPKNWEMSILSYKFK